jgi:hypothetical protein
MTFTQADLDAIDRAIVEHGDVLEVQFSDRLVRFKTFDEMLARRAFIARQLSDGSKSGTRFASTSKGTGRCPTGSEWRRL